MNTTETTAAQATTVHVLRIPSRPSRWMFPVEVLAGILAGIVTAALLVGVVSRYVFSTPLIWMDEPISWTFIWLTVVRTVLVMHRNDAFALGAVRRDDA